MGSAVVTTLTREQITAERKALAEVLGVDLDRARALAEAGLLDERQYAALRRIEDLDWLGDAG